MSVPRPSAPAPMPVPARAPASAPAASAPAASAADSTSASTLTVYHRGFAVAVLDASGRHGAPSFAFEVRHRDLLLHASPGGYGTATEAEGAARRFIDDALSVFG